jgi:hypothetical protein
VQIVNTVECIELKGVYLYGGWIPAGTDGSVNRALWRCKARAGWVAGTVGGAWQAREECKGTTR